MEGGNEERDKKRSAFSFFKRISFRGSFQDGGKRDVLSYEDKMEKRRRDERRDKRGEDDVNKILGVWVGEESKDRKRRRKKE